MDTIQRIVVLPEEPVGRINPYLHGHFAEHLGELIYPGICVEPDCDIPNVAGIRSDIVDALKPLAIPVLRWPGGCFADDYHWRDGIGDIDARPLRLNTHWGMAPESNRFGTHEFLALCRALGAEPYFAGNVGSGSPHELRDWVEYCNLGGRSALADERCTNGGEEPFRIRYWGVGNENWGCGGNMSPEEYAALYARYRTYLFSFPDAPVEGIACGPNAADWEWTRRLMECLKNGHTHNRLPLVQGIGAHYYCGTAGTATEYTETQWKELLSRAVAIDGIITGHRSILDEYDPERKIKLLIDEWGTWHPVEKGKPRSGLYQQNTIRDACVAGLTLDLFHAHADKLFMCNIAQLINVLQALLLVDGDRCIKTPTYHVFDLYRPHRGATSVRLLSASEAISDGEASNRHCRSCYRDNRAFALRAVHGSASVRDDSLCVTVVNTHPADTVELEIHLHQTRVDMAEVVTLQADDIHAHNTFDEPERVKLSAPVTVRSRDGEFRVKLPAASVTRVIGRLV